MKLSRQLMAPLSMRERFTRRGQRQRGHSLVEVLVALLLLAIGALGAVAMAMSSVRAARQASLLSLAVQMASGAGEAMRTRAGTTAGDNPFLQLDYDAIADGPPDPPAGCSGTPCDGDALAQAELDRLRDLVFRRFPFGRIKICRDGASWDAATLALRWECDGASGAPAVVKIGWRQPRSGADGEGNAAGRAPPVVALPLGGVGAPLP